MAKAVRVLRLIEYVYEDAEAASNDMLRWTHSKATRTMTMRSATLDFESLDTNGWGEVIPMAGNDNGE